MKISSSGGLSREDYLSIRRSRMKEAKGFFCALVFILLFLIGGVRQYARGRTIGSSEDSKKEGALWFDVSAGLSYGSIDGFLQTPAGGNKGQRVTRDPLSMSWVLTRF